jgi:uncharacterized Fe-S cluster protein YjdI
VTDRPLRREYATDEIVVSWEPQLCQHSERCWRGLPQVFDPKRRPWVDVTAASADEIEAQVARCPSRALKSRRPAAPQADA